MPPAKVRPAPATLMESDKVLKDIVPASVTSRNVLVVRDVPGAPVCKVVPAVTVASAKVPPET